MAIYRFEAKIVKRGDGKSVTAAAAYRAATKIMDERTGILHDYTRKGGKLHDEILSPDHAPSWTQDRAQLWNNVEFREDQSNHAKTAQLAREALVSLPHELTLDEQKDLVRGFALENFVSKGMIADIAIHDAHKKGDDRNAHAHILLTLRDIEGQEFGNKNRDWNSKKQLEQWREEWARHVNRALLRSGVSETVDHRSLKDQGIDREPEPKQGPVATQMEYEGRESHAGNDRRAAKKRNQELADLKDQAKVISLEMERLKRDLAKEGRTVEVEIIEKTQALTHQRDTLAHAHAHKLRALSKQHGQEEKALQTRHMRDLKRLTDAHKQDKRQAFKALLKEEEKERKWLVDQQNSLGHRIARALDPTRILKKRDIEALETLKADQIKIRKTNAIQRAKEFRSAKDRLSDKQLMEIKNFRDRLILDKTLLTREYEDKLTLVDREMDLLAGELEHARRAAKILAEQERQRQQEKLRDDFGRSRSDDRGFGSR